VVLVWKDHNMEVVLVVVPAVLEEMLHQLVVLLLVV
jgi:hypothetical protein